MDGSVGKINRLNRIREKIDQGLDIGPLNAQHLVVQLDSALGEVAELQRVIRSLEYELASKEPQQSQSRKTLSKQGSTV